ncbi:hypothetical protein ARAM_005832 [Aspergillus rambellii]|uniref:Uncharacterized protein n=1 Tax=Aspergillus rambellii TaxID=308745 RepID=A0A0F8VDE6_9EURO|nr:hypothetical protein ARAM_005832 [Aspergillus rambellii]
MSSSPSIIFYQGFRCTKVPRQPRTAAVMSLTTSKSNSPPASTTSQETASNPTSFSETLPLGPSPSTDSTFVKSAHSTASSTPSTSTASFFTSLISLPELSPETHNPARTESSTIPTTLATETLATAPTAIPSLQPLRNTFQQDHEDGTSLSAIFGSLFGGLGFIAVVLLVFFFYFQRRSKRSPFGVWSSRGIRETRASAGSVDSTTSLRREYRSGMSYLLDTSPVDSTFNLLIGGASSYHDPISPISPRGPSRFPDSTELMHWADPPIIPSMAGNSTLSPLNGDAQASTPPWSEISRAANRAPPDLLPRNPGAITRPEDSHTVDRTSMHSDDSLGSTLILPGRSSTGSSYRRISFPMMTAPPENEPSYPIEAATRDSARNSTRSDQFDLDVVRITLSRRSSNTLPTSLL